MSQTLPRLLHRGGEGAVCTRKCPKTEKLKSLNGNSVGKLIPALHLMPTQSDVCVVEPMTSGKTKKPSRYGLG
jgi:hypothetical protein